MDKEKENLDDIWDKHLEFEFGKKDVDGAMSTMTEDPHVHNVPTLKGGRGYNGGYDFYKNHFMKTTHGNVLRENSKKSPYKHSF
jgi:carboxymethylenebutenolidase